MSEDAKAEFLRRHSAEAQPRKSGCLPMALFGMVTASICGALSMIYIGFALVLVVAIGLILFQFLVFWPLLRNLQKTAPSPTMSTLHTPVDSPSSPPGLTPLQGLLAGGCVFALAPFAVGAALAAVGVPWQGYSASVNTYLLISLFALGGTFGWFLVRVRR